MTFDSLTYPDYSGQDDGSTYVEGGITATTLDAGAIIANYFTPSSAHIDDSGTEFTSGIAFAAGKLITSATFSAIALGYDMFEGRKKPFNVLISGMFMGNTVATARYALSDDFGKSQIFSLIAATGGFDSVSIQLLYPEKDCWGAPCAHFDLDQVDLALVPVPATGLALGTGLAVLLGAGRRRKASLRA